MNVLTDFKNTLFQTKRKRGRPRKPNIKNERQEINMKKPSQIELGSDSDSDPEYLDYLKEIPAKKKKGEKCQKA